MFEQQVAEASLFTDDQVGEISSQWHYTESVVEKTIWNRVWSMTLLSRMLTSLFVTLVMFNMNIHHCNTINMMEIKKKHNRPHFKGVISHTIRREKDKYQHSNKAPEKGLHVSHQSLQRGPSLLFWLLRWCPLNKRWNVLAPGDQKRWHIPTPVEPGHHCHNITL